MDLCKVRFDGSHYMYAPYKKNVSVDILDLILRSNEELGLDEYFNKKKFFTNEWAKERYPYKSKGRKPIPDKLLKIHNELKSLFISLYNSGKKYKEEELVKTLYELLKSNIEILEYYDMPINDDENVWLMAYTKKFVSRAKENLKSRKGLFRRKALCNDWNYFVTFTYDDKKHDEESFDKTLRKKLQNLHTNHGWLYMGCFERSKTDRLHFHGLVYVPDGKMRGNIREEVYFDTIAHRKAISFINEEFEDKIGRNDFKPITKNDLMFTNALEYIIKYIGKSDNKVVYSRGIKDDYYCLLEFEENVICKVSDNSPYYILADTSMIELNKNLEFVDLCI